MPAAPARPNAQLASFTFTRLVVATAFRLMFPFLPAIARGLGVSLEAVALLVTVRSALGLAGPALGSLADHWGRRAGMTLGLGLFVAGILPIAIWPTYGALLAGMVLSGAGNILVDATIYAAVGDQFSYDRRARAIALVEIGWSAAFLLGVPIAGWLIARGGWNAPFLWLAAAGVVALALNRRLMSARPGERRTDTARWDGLRLVARSRAAWGGLLFSALILVAHQAINIVFGAWMESAHGLRVEELGAASAVLGAAGIAGVALVMLYADRLGKRRMIGLGIAVNVLACLSLPFAGRTLTGALISLFVFYLSFEVTLITTLPLMSELVPHARATMMAGSVAAIAGGDALGAAIGPSFYRQGMPFSVGVSACANILGLLVLRLLVRERGEPGREARWEAAPSPDGGGQG